MEVKTGAQRVQGVDLMRSSAGSSQKAQRRVSVSVCAICRVVQLALERFGCCHRTVEIDNHGATKRSLTVSQSVCGCSAHTRARRPLPVEGSLSPKFTVK